MVRSRERQRFLKLLLNKGQQLFRKLSGLTLMHASFLLFAYFLSSNDEAAKLAADVQVRVSALLRVILLDIRKENSGGFLADVG